MNEHQRKLAVSDLMVGMYISDLDRPWCETPFPLQGFYIRTDADVREIGRYCKDVYVDITRDNSEKSYQSHQNILGSGKKRRASQSSSSGFKVKAVRVKHHTYPVCRTFKQEVKNAKKLQNKVNLAVENLMHSVTTGSATNLEEAKDVANRMVDSVVQNPDALLWVSRINESNKYWYNRSIHSTVWAIVMGRHIGLSIKDLEALAIGMLLCKVGRSELPAETLSLVSEDEKTSLEISQQYILYSAAIVDQIPELPDKVKAVVKQHCERHDGSGFPAGISGEKIPTLAKIAGLVDTYEGLINAEVSDESLSSTAAIAEIHRSKNILFQEDLVEEFIQSIGVYPTGTIVELNNHKVGVVVGNNPARRLKPKVMLMLDADGKPFKKRKLVDLLEEEEKDSSLSLNVSATLPRGFGGIDLTDPRLLNGTVGWRLLPF